MTAWRPVPGHEGRYEVSDEGQVRTLRRRGVTGGLLTSHLVRGIPYVFFQHEGRQSSVAVHRLVAAAFLGPRPEGQRVHFRDGDMFNARVENLYYAIPRRQIDDALDLLPTSDCVPWTGKLARNGYPPVVDWRGRRKKPHQHLFELFFGAVPAGLHLDHVCHTRDDSCKGGVRCPHRACVNPAHLEPVTPGENSRRSYPARSLTCKRGHVDDWLPLKSGGRYCRACRVLRVAAEKQGVPVHAL